MELAITGKEKDLLTLLGKGRTVTDAATELRITKQSASQRLRRLRFRYQSARDFCDDYERARAKMPGRYL